MRLTILVVLSFAGAVALAERQPFSRYQSIVDRQMFGELPPDFDPTKMPSEVSRSSGRQQEKELTKEQEKLQSAIRFSAINVTPDGATAVGFTDNSNPKTPVHYYLKVGESRDGWNVVSADAKTATMTIVKGDVEVSLTLGGSTTGKGGGAAGEKKGGGLTGKSILNTLHARRAARERKTEAELEKMRAERDAERAERARREEEEAAQREAERAEQRKQLQAIQDELRRAREEKQQKETESQRENEESNANNDAG